MRVLMLATLVLVLLVIPGVYAATVSISQSGADPGTVMKGKYFTITVSGLSGTDTGTASLINLPSGISVEEGTSKSFSSGTSSVSWTTAIASQTLTGQKIQVSISTAGSPTTAESDTFDIVLPPSLDASASPTSFSDPSGDKNLQLTIKNWGETTARDVAVAISLPSGVTIKSGSSSQVISTILGGTGGSGESKGIAWTLSFGSVSNSSINISITPSNADAKSVSVAIAVSTTPSKTSSPAGGGGGGPSEKSNIREVPKILAGDSYLVVFDEEYVPDIPSIKIFASQDQYYTKLSVNAYEKKPDWVSFDDAPGEVYRYLEIKYSKPNTYIEKAEVTFRVNETWLKQKDIDPATVVMYRLTETREWEMLPTSAEEAKDGYIYYTAEAPGFSWFTISATAGSGFRDIFAKVDGVKKPAPTPAPTPKPEEKPVTKPAPETKPPVVTPKPEVKPAPTPAVEEAEKKGICGPTLLAVIAALPLCLGRGRLRR
ncbi:PGF-pre-PGF domain-containing protein [Candidatus Pyrohabitans sp.]